MCCSMELLAFSEECYSAREGKQHLTYKNRHPLRMKQTLPSILPNDLIMFIIKNADGGLNTHKKKFQFCLLDIKQMVLVKELQLSEFGDYSPESACPYGAKQFRPRETAVKPNHFLPDESASPMNEVLIEKQVDWFCPGEGGFVETEADACWEPVFPRWKYY